MILAGRSYYGQYLTLEPLPGLGCCRRVFIHYTQPSAQVPCPYSGESCIVTSLQIFKTFLLTGETMAAL